MRQSMMILASVLCVAVGCNDNAPHQRQASHPPVSAAPTHRIEQAATLPTVAASRPAVADPDQTKHDEELIVAAFRLDVQQVKAALAAGANVNSVFGRYDEEILDRKSTRLNSSHRH